MRPPTRIARQGMVLNDTALTPYHARAAPAKAALGQFASPYFVASGSASPQRTPTYASGCRPARASSGSQLAPVPVTKQTDYGDGPSAFVVGLRATELPPPPGDHGEETVMAHGFAMFAATAPEVIRAAAREAEALGYGSFWVNHPGSTDGLASLAQAAGETRRIELGIGVIPLHTRGT